LALAVIEVLPLTTPLIVILQLEPADVLFESEHVDGLIVTIELFADTISTLAVVLDELALRLKTTVCVLPFVTEIVALLKDSVPPLGAGDEPPPLLPLHPANKIAIATN
jgi:hypothetical protein